MKIFKAVGVFLILAIVIAVLPGCGAAKTTAVTTQEATVTRGNLVNQISGSGNLAFSHTQDLPVSLFYPAGTKGTIGEVLVQTGDTVHQGQLLVTIDQNEWNDQLSSLEDTVTAKQLALTQSQISYQNAQQAVVTANETIASRQNAVTSAEISLLQAQTTLAAAITTIDFQSIQAAYNKARTWYDYVTLTIPLLGIIKPSDYELTVQQATEQLQVAQTNYDNALAGYTSQDVTIKKKQADVAQASYSAAQVAVIDAQNALPITQMSLSLAQGNLQNAQEALTKAQADVDTAKAMSPQITAPFDGVVTALNVAGGDQVLNGTVAVTIADPNKFEADILVSEMDISNVATGSIATVIANAFPTSILTANVTYISPTATISSGVDNYDVKVEVSPPGTGFGALFGQSGNGTRSGGFSAGSGSFQRQTGAGTTQSNNSSANQTFVQSAAAAAAKVVLKQGLSVTVNIVIASRVNVIIVPNGAIFTQNGNSYVNVIETGGKLTQTQVTTGISNFQYTEITQGLQEGQKIQVKLNTAPTNTINRGGGAIFLGR